MSPNVWNSVLLVASAISGAVPGAVPTDLTLDKRSQVLHGCAAIHKQYPSTIHYFGSLPYISQEFRFMGNTVQAPGCVFLPTEPEHLSFGIKLIGDQRLPFAVSSGRHSSNKGFSSTTGIQIDLKGFQHVDLSPDKSYVDVGSGNIWDNVYAALQGTGVNAVGGRVSGVGVGGFIAGGCGFSWKTNQHGLTCDTLIHADMVLPNGTLVTASAEKNPDLFWALKGGGNRFGVVYNWRLQTSKQPDVYGGVRTYNFDQLETLAEATVDFQSNNKDMKTQVISGFNFILGQPGATILGFHDGPDPGTSLAAFDRAHAFTDDWKVRNFQEFVASIPGSPSGTRGVYCSASVQNLTLPVMKQVINQTVFWGAHLRSLVLLSIDPEPFSFDYSRNAKPSAWPHDNNPLPINVQFSWLNPLDDDFYFGACAEAIRMFSDTARAEGQQIDDLPLYPNYAPANTPVHAMYQGNEVRLAEIEKAVDPTNVMKLTTFFNFS